MTDQEWIEQCFLIAQHSHDPRTQIGSVFLSRDGVVKSSPNGFYYGIRATEDRRNKSEEKYLYITHAERGAMLKAARHGIPLLNGTLYATWIICADCANAAVLGGIKRVVGYKPLFELSPTHWGASINAGMTQLKEAGIKVDWVDGPVDAEPILMDGKIFNPRTLTYTEYASI